MKVLVLVTDSKERSLVQTALEKSGHEMVSADKMEQALNSIESDQIRFVIMDEEAVGFKKQDLLQRADDPNKSSRYFLSLTSLDKETADFDATRHKPFSVSA